MRASYLCLYPPPAKRHEFSVMDGLSKSGKPISSEGTCLKERKDLYNRSREGRRNGGRKGEKQGAQCQWSSEAEKKGQEIGQRHKHAGDSVDSQARAQHLTLPVSCLLQLGVMGTVLTIYIATMHPSLPGGDAGELIVAASELGVAHPPGYPLYTVMMKAFITLLPWGSVAWRANLLTAIMAATAASFLYQAVFLITWNVAAGLLAAGMFSFSRLTWTWSVTAEVFALNNLLLAVLLLVAVAFSQATSLRKVQMSQVGALLCGLCLSNQHTTVVYIAVLVPWVLYSLHSHKVLSLRLLVRLSLWFLLGLLPYIYLPWSSLAGHARWTWGNQSTVSGFLTHLLRQEYGTMHLLKDHEGQGLFAGLIAYMEHVARDLTPAILFFFAATVFSIYRRWHKGLCEITLVMLAMLTTYTVFFAWRANLDIDKPLFRGVVERFWLQSDVILVTMAAVAFSDVVNIVSRLVPMVQYHMDKVIAVALISMHVAMNVGVCDHSGNRVVEDFALAMLRAFPVGSLVLTKGDLPSNSLRYYHLTEGLRPDITLFDQEVLTYDWSVPMLGRHYPDMKWPGNRMYLYSGEDKQGHKLFTFKQLLDVHYHRKPIFGCIGVQDHEPSWQAAYDLRPFGVCMQFIRKGSKFDMADWLKAMHHFASNWTHPVPVSEATWEEVASGEMWRAKTVAGLYLLESMDSVPSKEEQVNRLRKAYQVYEEAIQSHLQIPGYWHKNFALVCEKLRHLTPATETVPLMRTTIAHFKAYLDSGTNDPQMGAIENAIKQLQQYVDMVTGEGSGR